MQVAAFLEKNSYYYNLSWSPDPVSLDTAFICPPLLKNDVDINDYMNAIYGTHIICDDPDILDEINAKSQELDLLEFHFKSLQKQVDNIYRDEQTKIRISLIVMLLILSLCTACMISSILIFVEEHLREFAIHLISGAKMIDIVWRIVIQIGMPILVSDLMVFGAYKNIKISVMITIFSVVLCAVITLLPIVKLNRLGINGILKRGE